MPRLTAQHYLFAHDYLRQWWLEDKRGFAHLTSHEQWHLHDFFKPARELTESELRAHRQTISRQRPSLPHQAGKALAKFEANVDSSVAERKAHQHMPVRRAKSSEGQLVIQAVVKPEPDFSRLAIALAEHLTRQAHDHDAA